MGPENFLLQGSMDGAHLQTRGWLIYQKIDEIRRVSAEDFSILHKNLSLLFSELQEMKNP